MKPDLKTIFDTNRNTLLNMELRGNALLNLSNTSHSLDIHEESSQMVFSTLVECHKTMSILPSSGDNEDEYKHIISLQDLEIDNHEHFPHKAYKNFTLKTTLCKKELDAHLLKINTNAVTFVQEQGCDALYLATGFLTWFEDINSFKPRHAPLILIPVELIRSEIGANYQLRYTGGQFGTNFNLVSKLKNEFGLELPDFENTNDDTALENYFNEVKQIIFKKARWCIEPNKIVLSFFLLDKFNIFQDLDEDKWDEEKKPTQHPTLQKIYQDGFSSDHECIQHSALNTNKTEHLHIVSNIDSSQTKAVLAARSGADFIIQGAPGSGKTQTIVNIIAQSLADHKNVLFVSQKVAALKEVGKRLRDMQLDKALLELHTQQTQIKTVIRSLEGALFQDIPELDTDLRHEDIERLIFLRERLDSYCQLINTPIGQTGINYHQALGYFTKYEDTLLTHEINPEQFPVRHLDLTIWDTVHFQNALHKIQEIVDFLVDHGNPKHNIYASTQKEKISTDELHQIQDHIFGLISLYQKQLDQVHLLAQQIGLTTDFNTISDLERVTLTLSYLDKKPNLTGINTDRSTWLRYGENIIQLAEEAQLLHENINELQTIFKPEAFQFNWDNVRHALENKGEKFWRFISSEYRHAKNTLLSMTLNGLNGDADDWLELIDGLTFTYQQTLDFDRKAQILKDTLGIHYQNASTPWDQLLPSLNWIHDIHQKLAEGCLDQGLDVYLFAQTKQIIHEEALIELNQTCHDFTQKVNDLCHALALNEVEFSYQLSELAVNKINKLASDLDQIASLTYFTQLLNQLSQLDCDTWSKMALDWHLEPHLLRDAFQYSFYHSLATYYYQQHAEIRQFDRNEHEDLVNQFKEVDQRLLKYAQIDLRKKNQSRMQHIEGHVQLNTLLHEFHKKRQHLPLRQLLSETNQCIQTIKPVFLMSPTSVATYLEPNLFEFDLVIFDETSQMRPIDAYSALIRSKQAIIVGDVQQMPPSHLYDNQIIFDDEDNDLAHKISPKSLLQLFVESGAPILSLSHHYRSQHHSLFSISNQIFYQNQYMTLPAASTLPQVEGMSLVQVDSSDDQTGTKRNLDEAKAIAQAVIQHIQTRPNQSLGVVAFSSLQRDTILSELEKLRKKHPEFESFFYEQNDHEDFFVKIIENIQGDTRDTILVSITDGKNTEGELPLDFGRFNADGGEKRLNVLLTRARKNLQFFSHFNPDEMILTEHSPYAIKLFKRVLHEAQHATSPVTLDPQSNQVPFLNAVTTSIQNLGYQAEPQMTDAGFYVHIDIQDPNVDSRSILSVKCDCISGNIQENARDRERLHQQLLESMGWRFHSLWSTDWFRNRHVEINRIEDAIKQSLFDFQCVDQKDPHEDIDISQHKDSQICMRYDILCNRMDQITKYKTFPLNDLSLKKGDNLTSISTPTLANEINKIIEIESPIHIGQLSIRLLNSIATTKTNKQINKAILDATAQLVKKGKVNIDGEFLLSSDKEIYIRNRQNLPVFEKKFEFIYDHEIIQVIMIILKETVNINQDDLIYLTAYGLGFSACSKSAKLHMQTILQHLEETEIVKVKGDVYSF